MESTRAKEVILISMGLCWAIFLYTPTAIVNDSIPQSYQLIKNGDLIFRNGNSFISEIARNASLTEKRFSHVGIIVKNDRVVKVIHSIDNADKGFDGVVSESLNAYLMGVDDWAIYRVQVMPAVRDKIGSTALSMLTQKISFDYELDLSTTQSQYCTEFVMNVVNQVVGSRIITPKSERLGKSFISIEDVYRSNDILLVSELNKI